MFAPGPCPPQARGLRCILPWLSLCVVLLLPLIARAQLSLTATVQPDTVHIGEQVSLRVTLQAPKGQSRPGLTLPDLRAQGFETVGQMQFNSFDGRTGQSEQVLQLTLVPQRAGTLEIPALQVQGADGPVRTPALQVTVRGPGQGGDEPPSPAPGAAEEPPGRDQAEPEAPPSLPLGAPAVGPLAEQLPLLAPDRAAFMRWELSKASLWLGEQAQARLVLYINEGLRVRDVEFSEMVPQGFWTFDRKVRGGRLAQVGRDVFRREVVYDHQIFPLRAGELTLPEVRVQMTVSTGGFNRREQRLERVAYGAPVHVLALPAQGRPPQFAGPAVGQVRLDARTNRTQIQADGDVQLTVTTTVQGLLENVPHIDLPTVKGFRVFAPSTHESSSIRNQQLVGVRRQVFLLRPTLPGRLQLPALSLPYFDPERGQYAVAQSAPVDLHVNGVPSEQAQTAASQGAAGAPQAQATPLRAVHAKPDLAAAQASSAPLSGIWPVIWGPPVAFLALLGLGRWRRGRRASAGARTAKGAEQRCLRALAQLPKSAESYGAMHQLLMQYLEARFSESFSGLTYAQLKAKLVALNAPEATVQAWLDELENLDFARFAPGGSARDVGEAVQRAKRLVSHLEREVAR